VLARLESADFEAAVARSKAALGSAQAQMRSAEANVTSAEAQTARAEADLAEARRQLKMTETLVSQDVLPNDQLEAARSRVRVAEAVVGQARADAARARADTERAAAGGDQARADVAYNEAVLQDTFIRAPFTGTVVKKMAEVGESVAPIPPGVNISTVSGAIVALADLDTLEVEVDVAEANVASLREGQPAQVTVEAMPDRTYRGSLRQVIPTADRTRATVTVKVTILDKDQNLKPEMSAKVTFLEGDHGQGAAAGPRVVLVPESAVVTRQGNATVFALADGRAEARVVSVGPRRGDRVSVTQGLTGTETIVAHPPATLVSGTRVRVKGA
jgi:HlyD family secretion protein